MEEINTDKLREHSRAIRWGATYAIGSIGAGHIGGCLSVAELLAVLYFHVMNIDPLNPRMEGRDRLIMSKGHAGPALYAALAERGYFDKNLLGTLNSLGTTLPSHADMNKTPGIDMTAGSLGQGFSCAVGVAIGSKLKKDGACIYAVIGDGESQEGQIWEAAMYAAHMKLDNLIAFTDNNKLQIDGFTDRINSLGDICAKWESFGWYTDRVDGHDPAAIIEAIKRAKEVTGRPSMIILDTIKGKGVAFVEQAATANHNMKLTKEQTAQALEELSL